SDDVAGILGQIKEVYAQGDLDKAYELALIALTLRMSSRQQIRTYYQLARSRERNEPRVAIQYLDEALSLALRQDDALAFAHLTARQGHLHYRQHSLVSAADYFADALDAVHALSVSQTPVDAAFELDLLWGLATQHYHLTNHEEAFRCLRAARTVAPFAPDTHEMRRRAASIEWTAALLQRWRGRFDMALAHALDAHERYESQQLGTLAERARLRILVANVALDVVEGAIPPGTEANERIVTVEHHLFHALAHSSAAEDRAAHMMALLAYVRYCRVSGASFDRLGAIALVDAFGRETSDRLLQCQAQTALGDELAFRHESEPALNAYRRALDVIAKSDAAVMGHRAQQALRRAYAERGS
ncbi:MAG: hypothetical protein ACRDHP_15890, partial [Ktedonobacterales bacterium]